MALFAATRTWSIERDVRNYDPLVSLLRDNEAHGCLYTLVGNRRSGKTFALKSLTHLLGKGNSSAQYLDLSGTRLSHLDKINASYLLVDEAAKILTRPGGVEDLVRACTKLKTKKVGVLLTLTPEEWHLLKTHGGVPINIKDRHVLPPLERTQVQQQASRASWARSLVDQLLTSEPHWTYNPFVLELLLEVAEQKMDPHGAWTDPAVRQHLFSEVRRHSESGPHTYVSDVLRALSVDQNQSLVDISRGRATKSNVDLPMLSECGLISGNKESGWSLRDPLLQLYFPPPLRIHHLSDLHFGPKSMKGFDGKEEGAHGSQLSAAAGPATVRDDYLSHLGAKEARGQGVHAIVVSGDLGETGTRDQLQDAKKWIETVSEKLVTHPRLETGEPRVMVVGGNHDVDWATAASGANPHGRHLTFAQVLDNIPHPHLEQSPETRTLHCVRWRNAGITFVLLGSAEWGGSVVGATPGDASYVGKLAALLEEIQRDSSSALLAGNIQRYQEIRRVSGRIDPSVVHQKDLDRIRSLKDSDTVRIAVLHHPVSAVPAAPEIAAFSGLINAGAVKDTLLANKFQLVLHGHQHVGWLGRESWPGRHGDRTLNIASAPTLGSSETTDQHGYIDISIFFEGHQPVEMEVAVVKRIGTDWTPSGEKMTIPLTTH